jgi:hypothetical protein
LKDVSKCSRLQTASARTQSAQNCNAQEVILQEFKTPLKTTKRIIEIAEVTSQYNPSGLRDILRHTQITAHFAEQTTMKSTTIPKEMETTRHKTSNSLRHIPDSFPLEADLAQS